MSDARGAADRPIGVFDSGVGGLSILKALRVELPGEKFVYFADTAHAPYGERGDAYVIERTRAVVDHLRRDHDVKAIVIACNTATAAAVHLVRAEQPNLLVVGVEPALKPASTMTRTRRIGVMATRGTLASAKFRALRDSLKDRSEFVLQACDGLADAIQRGDDGAVSCLCRTYVGALAPFGVAPGQIDTLVLGCTHYPFATSVLAPLLPPAIRLVETGEPVARHARVLLTASGMLAPAGQGGVALLSSGSTAALEAAASRWL